LVLFLQKRTESLFLKKNKQNDFLFPPVASAKRERFQPGWHGATVLKRSGILFDEQFYPRADTTYGDIAQLGSTGGEACDGVQCLAVRLWDGRTPENHVGSGDQ
jgi:hypothetical protein